MKRIRQLIIKTTVSFFLLGSEGNVMLAQQPCNDDIIMNVKGSWKKAPDFHIDPRVISRVDKMQQLLQTAYPQPKGMEAKWYRSGPEYPEKKGPVSFELRAKFFSYYCNKNVNKLLLDAGNADFDIWANHLGSFAEKNDKFLIQNLPVYLLKKKTRDFKGFPLYEDIFNGNTGNSGTIMLMMTRLEQLPYTHVTKKQYLQKFLEEQDKFYQVIADMNNKMPVLSDAEEEAYKKKELDRIEKNGDPVVGKERAKKYFLQNYISSKQKKENALKESKGVYNGNCKAAKDLLSNASVAELAKPALFKDLSYDASFTGFANEKDGRELVLLNPGYFNPKLPDNVPQFIIVLWAWKNETPCHYLRDQLEANFNFSALQQMIDK